VLAEETGEVCRAIVKSAQGIRGDDDHWMKELRKESVDVLISLLSVAEHYGFDLGAAVDERWDEVRRRQFGTKDMRRSTPCECGHPWTSHIMPSFFPIACQASACDCEHYSIDRSKLASDTDDCRTQQS
jgi:NTP pyrophosphatase (non-canonical NTP hydrolase)